MTYAIIAVGGKQYRVREGERLFVDRLPYAEGKTFHPDLLLVGGDGEARVSAKEIEGEQVTARVAAHVLGEKIVVGKHRQRTGFRRRNGHRSRLSQIEIETIEKKRRVEIVDPSGDAPSAPAAKPARSRVTEARKTEKKGKK